MALLRVRSPAASIFFSPLRSHGSSTLPVAMANSLKNGKINFDQTVVAIAENKSNNLLTVTTASSSKDYAAVVSTVTLGCLSTIDLTTCEIAGYNYPQWSAIRELQYGPAIKIGIRWDSPWWQAELGIVGGQSFTDLPIRTMLVVSCIGPGRNLIGSCAVSIPHTLRGPRNPAPSLSGGCEQDVLLNSFLYLPTVTAGLRTQSVWVP